MVFFLLLALAVTFPIISASAVQPVEKIAKHETPDNIKRIKQVFDVKEVEKGSAVISTNAVFSLNEHIGEKCVIVLNENGLNKDEVSDNFTCGISNNIPLKTNGLHALQSRLNNEKFNMQIKSIDGFGVVNVMSNSINLNVTYKSPTYFAKITDGIVTNMVVADQEFINSSSGQWVSYNPKADIVGIGFTYQNNIFTSQSPYPSWMLFNNTWMPPVPHPNDGQKYKWDEANKNWVNLK